MAVTKVDVVVLYGQTSTAGSSATFTDAVDVRDAYGAVAFIRIVNGATGPTIPCYTGMQYGIDEANDGDPSSGMLWVPSSMGVVGSTANSGIVGKAFEIMRPAQWVRFYYGYNTGQDCTVDIGLTKITRMI